MKSVSRCNLTEGAAEGVVGPATPPGSAHDVNTRTRAAAKQSALRFTLQARHPKCDRRRIPAAGRSANATPPRTAESRPRVRFYQTTVPVEFVHYVALTYLAAIIRPFRALHATRRAAPRNVAGLARRGRARLRSAAPAARPRRGRRFTAPPGRRTAIGHRAAIGHGAIAVP